MKPNFRLYCRRTKSETVRSHLQMLREHSLFMGLTSQLSKAKPHNQMQPPMSQSLRLSQYPHQYLNTTTRSPYVQISFMYKECYFSIASQEALVSAQSNQSSTVTRVQFCRNLKLLSSFISIVVSMYVTYMQTGGLPVYRLICSQLSSTLLLPTVM